MSNYIAYMDDIITPTLNPSLLETPTYTTVMSMPNDNITLYNYSYTFPSLNTTYYPNEYTLQTTGYTGTNCKYTCSCCIPKYMNNNYPHVGIKIIPKNAEDAITFENINDGDILIDFKRDNNKTEYDYGTYYKESTLKFILQSNKNQFTMEQLDKSSIVKYTAKY